MFLDKEITYIGESALYSCSKLREIKVVEENQYYCDIDGVLYNKSKTVLIQCP